MKKLLKKGFATFLSAGLLLSMAACGGTGGTGSTASASDTPPATESASQAPAQETQAPVKIGVTLMNFQTEFSIGLKDYIEAKASELGNVELSIVDAQGDAAKQVQQVESFIAQKMDAIILQPQEQEASSPCVDKAKAAGIPIVNVNSMTVSDPDAYVGSDDIQAAEIAMTYIAEQLGGKGNVVMMHGHPGQTAEVKRSEGAQNILAKNPDMKLLDEQTANWDRAEAMTLMENWIQAHGGDMNAVFCQNDEMAMGALNALLQNNKKEGVLVVGVDAIADALQSIKDGKLDATVYQDCKGQAEGALETAVKLAGGQTVEAEDMIPFILVTKDNVDAYLNP